MAATEVYFIPYKMASLKWDPAIVKEEPFTDVKTRLVAKLNYKRIATGIIICEVDCATGGVRFLNGSFPPANRVNQIKGITEMEIL